MINSVMNFQGKSLQIDQTVEYFCCTGILNFLCVENIIFFALRGQIVKQVHGKVKRILCVEDDLEKN